MNSDRTESDWQGLVSEVRPRRRPGGMGRAELPPALGPRPRVAEPGQGRAGDAHPVAAARCLRATRQVRRSSRTFRSIPVPLSSMPYGASLWGGAFPQAGLGPGLEREARGSGRRSQVPPAFLVTTVLEPSDWTPGAEAERWCQGGNPGPG